MARNYNIELHQQWIGYLNPTGLVFSPQALEDAQVVINETAINEQKVFREIVCSKKDDVYSFAGFKDIKSIFKDVLNWEDSDLVDDKDALNDFSFNHPQFNEVVSPSFLVNACHDKKIIIQTFNTNIDFDSVLSTEDNWNSSIHFKLERLLREKQVSTGILVSKNKLRLIYAPRGETSGYIDFPFEIMIQPSGRLVFAAFAELFSVTKVFNSKKGQSLIDILDLSRKYQAKVSIELSGQVLEALYELLRGFQSANDESGGEILKETLENNKQDVYEGLLTVLLRMVFIMYAEDRNLLATDEIYQSSYSLAGLYERLRQDEAQNPDTMDSRYGAWAQLLSLFRLIYDGADYESERGKVTLPARHGHLFDPNRFLFLEGRKTVDELYENTPKLPDGIIFRVLSKLLILDSDRISYRTLDVEQIGSVYETMMGFELDIVEGETRALKPSKVHGAPVPVNLDYLLSIKKERSKKLAELTDIKLTDKVKKEFDSAKSLEELEASLEKRIDQRATPFRLSKGAMILKPSEARRKSGSHYTPRELTEPIVETALSPIFERLGKYPKPEEILDLKICDPAMGSGAFLVEACRQLSEKLVESWNFHKIKNDLPPDEDELLYARRLIAQRCLYGVDRNHMAVNLAKLSLWLVTIAKDHSFSFLDHNFKHGDSLVGLSNKQIMAFDYKERNDVSFFSYIHEKILEVQLAREEIQKASQENQYDALKIAEGLYNDEIKPLKLVGDLIVSCFLEGKNEKERDRNIQQHQIVISNFFSAGSDERLLNYCKTKLSDSDQKVVPFHWELEFPEIFNRLDKGFDSFVGNPPFLGGQKLSGSYGDDYLAFIKSKYSPSFAQADLVSYFFRMSFSLISNNGTIGFISTNTISQGDTRKASLEFICNSLNGQIFSAIKRKEWPGVATVVVSIVFLAKKNVLKKTLDGKCVSQITPFLTENGTFTSPVDLKENSSKAFSGHYIYGDGFKIDDLDLIERFSNEINTNRLKRVIGGADFLGNVSSCDLPFVFDFNEFGEQELKDQFPEAYEYLVTNVKPERLKLKDNSDGLKRKTNWWKWGRYASGLQSNLETGHLTRVLMHPFTSKNLCFGFVEPEIVIESPHIAILLEGYESFCLLQSNIHELWARLFSSSMKDDLRYTPSDCFETFPFPANYLSSINLRQIGQIYYEYRLSLLSNSKDGLTKIYNRFHDRDDSGVDILKLRELHRQMDEAVLSAYGWEDIVLDYDFYLDYEEDEEEAEANNRKKKKPFRYKLHPETHDEILARLLKLNKDRYDAEVKLGLHKKKRGQDELK